MSKLKVTDRNYKEYIIDKEDLKERIFLQNVTFFNPTKREKDLLAEGQWNLGDCKIKCYMNNYVTPEKLEELINRYKKVCIGCTAGEIKDSDYFKEGFEEYYFWHNEEAIPVETVEEYE